MEELAKLALLSILTVIYLQLEEMRMAMVPALDPDTGELKKL
jgi:hypothetical protein